MAITTKKKYTGQQSTAILDGNIRIEEGNNRMVITNGSIEMLTITQDGIVLNDGTNRRMIIGKMPDGTIGIIISKTGADVFNLF